VIRTYTYILFVIIIVFDNSIAQNLPTTYNLEKNGLLKILEDPTPGGNGVEYIEFMGEDIWIATSSGVSKSKDNGNSWTNYIFDDNGVSALGIKNDTVWIATWFPKEIDGEVVAVGTGLHYTADQGENWTDIPQPVDELDDSSIVYGINTLRALPIAAVENNFTRDIGFTSNSIWIVNFAGGIRRSDDIGLTWEKVVLPPDYLDSISPSDTLNFTVSPTAGTLGFESNLNHRLFSVKVVDDSTVYVGSAAGINKSTDGGISWRKFKYLDSLNSISGNFILDINYDYSQKTVWAATWKAEGENEFYGLSSSSDGGENWNTYLAGENVHDIGFTRNNDGTESDVLVASDNGIFRSFDLGESWVLAPEMRDNITNIPITTNNFRAVNSVLDFNGNNDIWFGSEAGSARLKETGNIWEGEWKVFISSPDIISGSKTIAFPNPFTPDEERVKIKFSFQGNSKSVTIRIFDFGMNLVKTILQNVNRAGNNEYIDNWDGRDERNEFVPNGVYFYRIDIGNDEPLYGKVIVLL